jgi:hypothetical protein
MRAGFTLALHAATRLQGISARQAERHGYNHAQKKI